MNIGDDLSIQLYSLRNYGDLEAQLSALAGLGFRLPAASKPQPGSIEAHTGLVMQPLVILEGEYSASLDGMTLGSERIVEIKCPVKGRDSTLWKAVEAGRLPEHYAWQVQHQLMVTKAAVADVFVFDGGEGVVFRVAPDPARGRRSTRPGTPSCDPSPTRAHHRSQIGTPDYVTIPSG